MPVHGKSEISGRQVLTRMEYTEIYISMDEYGQMNGWMEGGWMDGWMKGQRQMVKWIDGGMDCFVIKQT